LEGLPGVRGNIGRLLVLVAALVVICIVFTLWSYDPDKGSAFANPNNLLKNLPMQLSVNLILSVGMTFVIISGGIDLSVGWVLTLANVVFARMFVATGSVAMATLAAAAAGTACGAASGAIVVLGRVPSFIATLGMFLVARGLSFWAASGNTIPARASEAMQQYLLYAPAILSLAAVIVAQLLLSFTRFGRYVFAIGGNEEASRLSGIHVGGYRLLAFSACGLCAGLGAVIYWAKLMCGNPLAGQPGYELYAIAAVVIGGTSLMGGEGSIVGTLLGAVIMGVLFNGLMILNVQDYHKQILIGIVIIVAALLDRLRRTA
jgi:ribose transport system permease protein